MKITNLSISQIRIESRIDRYRVNFPVHISWDCGELRRDIVIPSGFETDGASVPRFFWRIAGSPYDPQVIEAAIVHDYLYSSRKVPRDEADAVLRAAMRQADCSWLKAAIYWLAVRAFGWIHWCVVACCAAVLLGGCVSRSRNVDMAGMYASESGCLAIGTVEIMSAPEGEETAIIKYAEDTAWLSPSTKTHKVKILLTGTNSAHNAVAITKSICGAFVSVNGNDSTLTATITPSREAR